MTIYSKKIYRFGEVGLWGAALFILALAVFSFANTAKAQDQNSWTMDPGGIRDAVNAKGYNIPSSSAFYFDGATAQKVCQILGYNRVVSMDTKYPEKHSHTGYRDGWYSPGDNKLSKWTGASFHTANARKMGNRWISSLTCADKIGYSACSNNVDDDGDGKVDMNDPGCSSSSDNNEADSCQPTPTPTPKPDPINPCGSHPTFHFQACNQQSQTPNTHVEFPLYINWQPVNSSWTGVSSWGW